MLKAGTPPADVKCSDLLLKDHLVGGACRTAVVPRFMNLTSSMILGKMTEGVPNS